MPNLTKIGALNDVNEIPRGQTHIIKSPRRTHSLNRFSRKVNEQDLTSAVALGCDKDHPRSDSIAEVGNVLSLKIAGPSDSCCSNANQIKLDSSEWQTSSLHGMHIQPTRF